MGLMDFFFGKPEQNYQQSTLGPEQQALYRQLLSSGAGYGGGGAFGSASDYYRDILSNNPELFQAFINPEMRQFREQIIPELSEQFAGMGSGALSSSGFRNASVNAGTDLAERLGAIRANLRNQSAQGLTNIGQLGLGQYNENIHRPATSGFMGGVAQGVGGALGGYLAGGPLGALTNGLSGFSNGIKAGSTSPYGGNAPSSSFNYGRLT